MFTIVSMLVSTDLLYSWYIETDCANNSSFVSVWFVCVGCRQDIAVHTPCYMKLFSSWKKLVLSWMLQGGSRGWRNQSEHGWKSTFQLLYIVACQGGGVSSENYLDQHTGNVKREALACKWTRVFHKEESNLCVNPNGMTVKGTCYVLG